MALDDQSMSEHFISGVVVELFTKGGTNVGKIILCVIRMYVAVYIGSVVARGGQILYG